MQNVKVEIAARVQVLAAAILDIRRFIAESDEPSVYGELANDLRIAGGAVSRMNNILNRSNT